MRLCGFCGGTGVNKEHVWPDWLRKVILDSRAMGGQEAFHAQIERGGSTSEFKNPSLEIKVGMPCSSCNGGWMSALENQVKPVVTTMAYRGDKTLLDADRQLALTRWFVPRTDADGNDVAGVRLPQIAVPLATYTGWSLRGPAFAGDDLCDAFGQKLDFHPSAVAHAANNLHRQRLLLGEDVERIVEAAGESAVGKRK